MLTYSTSGNKEFIIIILNLLVRYFKFRIIVKLLQIYMIFGYKVADSIRGKEFR